MSVYQMYVLVLNQRRIYLDKKYTLLDINNNTQKFVFNQI